MSLQVMVTGKITLGPQEKVSQNGNPYTFALMSVPTNQERLSTSVFAFGDLAEILAALDKGDEIAVSGSANISEWEQEGQKRVSLSINAEQIMSVYSFRRKKKRMQDAHDPKPEENSHDFGDSVDDI